MAERRRIIPSSVGPLFPVTKEKETVPSLRFDLTLKEPSDKTCSVFSYCQLVKNAVRGEKESNGVEKSFNNLDEEDMDGLELIAKKFEEKYTPHTKKGKKKRSAFIDDLIDVGMGYDETDPFVDNSECYDELVPDVLTTQLGGFYINQGQLHFRERSDSENSGNFQDMARRKKTPKKKHRKTSDGEKREGKRKRNPSSSSDKAAKKMRKQLQRQFGKVSRKKKNLSGRIPTVAELLKQRDEAKYQDSDDVRPSPSKPSASSTSASNAAPKAPSTNAHSKGADAAASNGLLAAVEESDLQASMDDIDPSLDLGLIMSDMILDSDMAAAMEETLKGPMGDGEASLMSSQECGDSPGTQGDEGMDGEEVSLPSGLPTTLVFNVDKIREAATKSVEGKCKFFTASVNSLLLKIENQSRELSCGVRSNLYSHLASNLPCTKETLLKRAKKLRLNAHDSHLKEPLQKLREAIALAMPAQLERYQQECQMAAQDKYNAMMNKSQSAEEESKPKGSRGIVPSKKFQWTDAMRELLYAIVDVKLQTYKLSKIRTQSAEDYLKHYLENEIKPLWPAGWMQTRSLFKESRSVHRSITSLNPKQRKMLPIAKKPLSTKPLPQEASETPRSDEADLGRKQDKPDGKATSSVSSRDSFVHTILDYASDNSKPDSDLSGVDHQKPSPKDLTTEPKSNSRPKTGSTSEIMTPRMRDSRDFVDMLIAEQLALQDKAESNYRNPSRKATGESEDKQEAASMPIRRNIAQEESTAASLQLDILRQAALLSQSNDALRENSSASKKDLVSYADEIKAMAKASASSIHKSGRNVQAPPTQAGRKVTKTSFQMEFEKLYSMSEQGEVPTMPEVSTLTLPAKQKSAYPGQPKVNVSAITKAAQQKTAFEKLRLAGQAVSSSDVSISASQPVVKLTRHPNLAAGKKSNSDVAAYTVPKLASPPSTHLQQYSGPATSREPLAASHRLAQHGNTPMAKSAASSLLAKGPSTSLPMSSAGSIYLPRKDTTFQSIPHSGDRSTASKPPGKITSTSPAYTSPSPPKGSPHSARTSPYSTSPGQVIPASTSPRHTSPLGQKTGFSQYQRTSGSTSPGHSSSFTPSGYTAGMPTLPGYQQLSLADLTRKQRPTSPGFVAPTFPMGSGHVSPGHQVSPSQSTATGDAIITGPAPGTFYHTQNAANIAAVAAPSTNSQRLLHQQITLDSMLYAHQAFPEPHRKQKQHRIP